MIGAGHHLTPTQLESIERSKAFKAKIAEAASRLADQKTISALEELPVRSEPVLEDPAPFVLPPVQKNWFEIVEELAPTVEEKPSTVRIQRAVAGYFNVGRAALRGDKRTADIVLPRQIAHYLCKDLTDLSLIRIGRYMGGRDHSTIHYSNQKITAAIRRNWLLAFDVAMITKAIVGDRPQ